MEKLEIIDLSFSYGKIKALNDITFSVSQGDFLLICGRSGCGKSTLLRHLKPALAPVGAKSGDILYNGKPIEELDERARSSYIAFVMQNPDDQIVADKVWHELAFGLESLGLDNEEIRRRVAEMASFFGIKDWYHKNVTELSGGQKQLLCLASAMTMRPELLILDEPTSQLDPIAASELISTLGRINRELGTTVILSEHRPEDSFAYANKVAIMDSGRIIAFGNPSEVGNELREKNSAAFLAMPAAMRIYAGVGYGECPVTVREGRKWLTEFASLHEVKAHSAAKAGSSPGETLLKADEIWFRYDKPLPYTVKGLSIELKRGEIFALLGSNGSGKTTTLRILAGLEKNYRGVITSCGRIGMLPQDPKLLLMRGSVREEISAAVSSKTLDSDSANDSQSDDLNITHLTALCRLDELLDRHPYSLSGGEQQRTALAKVLAAKPDILLLDEPTKGIDASFRLTLASILKKLRDSGTAILIVSHDTEFCAEYADRCGLFFDGAIVSEGTPHEFFGNMSYYTTPTSRIARGICDAVTPDELIIACGGDPILPEQECISICSSQSTCKKRTLPLWRKLTAGCGGIAAAISIILALSRIDLSELRPGNLNLSDLKLSIIFIVSLIIVMLALGVGKAGSDQIEERPKLSKHTIFSMLIILIMIPATVILGLKLPGRAYYLTSLLVLIELMLPFFIGFEKRKPTAREVARTASLCALGVAGRAAFFMLPQFKPVLALTIISGVSYGCETGFLVGAITMLTSNILFSQGPWTPWQMFAMGLCGALAGLIFRRRPNQIGLCIYGGIAAVGIYGLIMNLSSAVIWQSELNLQTILVYLIAGFPMDCVHAAATVLFLWILNSKTISSATVR